MIVTGRRASKHIRSLVGLYVSVSDVQYQKWLKLLFPNGLEKILWDSETFDMRPLFTPLPTRVGITALIGLENNGCIHVPCQPW